MKKCSLLMISFLILGSWSFSLAQAVAPDITRLTVGARILGMGKAFVGLADDVGSIYTNPAGLGNFTDEWQISSMSGTFMEDFSYLSFAGVYPTKFGNWAFGYANSSIAGGYATRIKPGTEADPVYEPDLSQPVISNSNNVILLSYGNRLVHPKLPDETMIGVNVKLFSANLSGDGIGNGSASGKELDFGLLFKPKPWLSVGTTVQNLLSEAMGGKLVYASGHTETYPAIWENGVAINVLGKNDALRTIGDQQLKFLFDIDYYPERANFPMIYHTGLEWLPINMLAVRMGIDQDAAGNGSGTGLGTNSNLTAGVGIKNSGFAFDYAFHQFAGAPGISNNFFSLSYQQPILSQKKSSFEERIEKNKEEKQ